MMRSASVLTGSVIELTVRPSKTGLLAEDSTAYGGWALQDLAGDSTAYGGWALQDLAEMCWCWTSHGTEHHRLLSPQIWSCRKAQTSEDGAHEAQGRQCVGGAAAAVAAAFLEKHAALAEASSPGCFSLF